MRFVRHSAVLGYVSPQILTTNKYTKYQPIKIRKLLHCFDDITLSNGVCQQQTSSKYGMDTDDDILRQFTDRSERGGEWTSASASWITKTSTDERQSTLPSSGLRALYEVVPDRA